MLPDILDKNYVMFPQAKEMQNREEILNLALLYLGQPKLMLHAGWDGLNAPIWMTLHFLNLFSTPPPKKRKKSGSDEAVCYSVTRSERCLPMNYSSYVLHLQGN